MLGLLVLSVLASCVSGEVGSLLTCLKGNGDNLDQCHVEFGENLKSVMKTGDAAHNIKQEDPMAIDQLDFNLDEAAFKIKAKYTENIATGLSSYTIKSFKTNTMRKLLFIELAIPTVSAKGKYDLDGTAAVVDLERSQGDYQLDIGDADVVVVMKLVNQGGQVIVEEDPRLTIKIGTMKVEMKNLFGGSAPQLAEVIHKFVNNDPDKFIQVIIPVLKQKIGDLLKNYFNAAAKDVDPAIYGF